MYGYIYLTTNLINGTKYVGQHKGIFDSNYLGSGKLIRRAIKKYGSENFNVLVLEYAPTKERLNELEINYIAIMHMELIENEEDRQFQLNMLLERFEIDIKRQLEDIQYKEKELLDNLETLKFVREKLEVK